MTIASDLLQRHIETLVGEVPLLHLRVYAFADPEAAVAEVKAEAVIKPTGRIYRQEYVVFLRAAWTLVQ